VSADDERRPVLESIEIDSRTNLLVMRWIRFLMDRVGPDSLPALFGYYREIGWIGEEVEEYLGIVSEGTRPSEVEPGSERLIYEAVGEDNILVSGKQTKQRSKKQRKPEGEWKLTAEDHLTSWWFVLEISGVLIDKNLWHELGQRIDAFEQGFDEFCRI
jgi:archaellum component FlaD/FlaE